MYVITKKTGIFDYIPNEQWYLGWQEPAWDEDGYFWSTKDSIRTVLEYGNNREEHPFVFATEKEAVELAEKIEIKDYIIEKWI